MSDLFDDTQLDSEVPQDVIIADDGNFTIIPNSIISHYGQKLGAYGLAVYVGLRFHANRSQGMSAFVFTETLAKELNIGESTVRRELTNLSDIGLITKTRRFGRSSVYRILAIRYDIAEQALPRSESSATTELYNKKNLTRGTSTNSENEKPSRKRRTKALILSPYSEATKNLVNQIIQMWPETRPGDKSKINIDTALFASRLDEILTRWENMTPEFTIAVVKRYLAEGKEYPHGPEFFFGPGKKGGDGPPWFHYAKMEFHERQAK
jgi:hypothetical protein